MNGGEIHFKGKIAQKVIVEHDNKILLVQDPRESRNIWELPGGRMNIEEDPREAIQREFYEEMGTEITTERVIHMEQFIQGNEKARAFVIVYAATLNDPAKDFSLSDEEVSEVVWVPKETVLDYEMYPEYKRALEIYLK